MARTTKAETEKRYRRLVVDQERSGLTIREFAESRGIPRGTLSSWRHQIKKRDAARTGAADAGKEARRSASGRRASTTRRTRQKTATTGRLAGATAAPFVPVILKADLPEEPAQPASVTSARATVRTPTARGGYELVLVDGRVVRVPADFEEGRVTALLRAVSAC